jgi:predicted dehydrogenase/threonine dehydrogenase-like Zn-dependent dehydrogenase
MKQVVQPAKGGPVRVIDVPRPTIGPTEVLVQTVASAVSPGTERAVTKLAQSTLLAKARARPDLVRQVIKKAKADGIAKTARSVQARLDDDVPLGYSAAGIALEVGEAVAGISPGQMVATGGAGKANHAEFQAVPGLLCAPVPEGVPAADAAFATVASVALHSLRLAEVGPGAKVVVIGLGLLGQLGVRLAQAAGCDVAGIDVSEFPVTRASEAGALALIESGDDTTKAVLEWSRGRGADAVLLMAASASSAIAGRAPELCRDQANVVVVGDVGLDLDRRPFYEKELNLRFARSYGPGRYERAYEEWGVDYPAGLVRWTEGRNFEAVLDLLAGGRFEVTDLVTHRYPIVDAALAYDLVESGTEPSLGIVFDYPAAPQPDRPIVLRPRSEGALGVGLIGAGAFARTVLVPAFKEAGFDRFVSVASASGLSARRMAERAEFEQAVSGPDAVIDDPHVEVVVIATPHDSHARLAARALRAGKHVFCEKPLALTIEELDDVEAAQQEGGGVLFVGFNRRYSESIRLVRSHFAQGTGALVVTYRVSAGSIPAKHWYNDRRQGGRLLGEVCHFIDTCGAIAGSDPVDIRAVGSTPEDANHGDQVVVSLRYGDGTLATISYATAGHPSVEKERIDILGRDRSATVYNFEELAFDGGRKVQCRGKGHVECIAAFRSSVRGGSLMTSDLASTRASMNALADLTSLHSLGWTAEDR